MVELGAFELCLQELYVCHSCPFKVLYQIYMESEEDPVIAVTRVKAQSANPRMTFSTCTS